MTSCFSCEAPERVPLVATCSAGRIVQKDLDIAEHTDAVTNPMIPHVVLEPV